MKPILYFFLMLSVLGAFACGKKKKMKKLADAGFVWMKYDETKCDNPWHFEWLVVPTDEQLAAAVKSHLEGGDIKILEMKTSRDEDFVSCEACNCPNGFRYFVKVKKSEVPKLKALKFTEAKFEQLPK